MSSSRIIKSDQADTPPVSGFCFAPFRPGAPDATASGSGFRPLGIFDASDVSGFSSTHEKGGGAPQAALIELSEEDLEYRLRESYNSGLKDGKELADRGLTNVFRALRTATLGVHELRERVLRQSEDDLLKLVMSVARRVIQREVMLNRSILADIVRAATAPLSERDEVTVRLHPDDVALITAGHDEALKAELVREKMRLKADPSIAAGGCQIDTEMGTIDASLEAQLDEIFRHLLEERNQSLNQES